MDKYGEIIFDGDLHKKFEEEEKAKMVEETKAALERDAKARGNKKPLPHRDNLKF